MVKKLYINVYGSPYVNMEDEEKIWQNIDPLPEHKLLFEGASNKNPHSLSSVIIDAISNLAINQIIHVYEGNECIYADAILSSYVDFSKILNCFIECEGINLQYKKTESLQSHNFMKIKYLNIDDIEGYPIFKPYNGKSEGTILNYYMVSNLGATGEEYLQIIGTLINLSESFGGFPSMIEWFKDWLKIGEYREHLFNGKTFYKSFLEMQNVDLGDCVMTKLKPRKKNNGFNIIIKYKKREFIIKTNRKSCIKELESESIKELKYRR